MEIKNLPIQEEIDKIISEGPKGVHSEWTCLIETPEKIIEPIKLFSLDIVRNYDENFADYILADLTVLGGTYEYEIAPFLDEVTILVNRYPLREATDAESEERPVVTRRYRAIPLNVTNKALMSEDYATANKEEMDLSNIFRVEFQLIDISLEHVLLYEVGGVYRDTVPADVIKYLLTDISNSLDIPVEDKLTGVTIVPPDNTKPHKHVILPHGIKPFDVPAYIQDNWGGVYNTGIGCYIQNGNWFIWPEYNTKRFETEVNTLTIINLPDNKFSGIERTFRNTDKQTIIISTGETTQHTTPLEDQINQGSGVRFVYADKLFNGFGKTENNKHTLNRKTNTFEYFGINRAVNNKASVSENKITNNIYAQTSRLARREGTVVSFVWEHSDPDIIYPGMPVKVVYVKDNLVEEKYGVVYRSQHFIHSTKSGIQTGRFITNSSITVFLE